ncbi:Proteinase inhibitor I35, tissue inhibitor of metalloproteinase family and Tissue inhibitor of metalloproteinases-like, OB-fold domain-containing protein [Strongyloides ratti]|uniref:Proteinase inhibitor I35, tissue inhibitor of metalloproteinase family and Tissue inhibitor of metalloproteinases-like, OB-fold domain-containing protein n=1 Tax=Strongyloides ratti TaxID=34506 RepID=A0A090MZM7_STRRB|nr:Proteinase inhibitor I35, tissue inhibitor of metalloproteinase family and Tissue inhibitor of metalloproteinases-like, OB-fold domain-containing protein [Strongyloides ratti]CEF69204.1 Proteinase inhibitor I35, tissue inhibitor of metalloproteinase family and Tissue inhibitor of metalloproteinases-like, OB-fold domain-containing protein [Strongyloides ratti]
MVGLNFVNQTESCDCMRIYDKNVFCFSEWISHVKILNKDVQMVYGTNEAAQEEDSVKYTVQHLEILKKPENIKNESLSNLITTPSNTAMSGALNSDNTLTIRLCGGLTFNEDSENSIKKIKNYQKVINCS